MTEYMALETYDERLAKVRSGEPLSIYLAGPMTGLPEHNFPAFRAMAKQLRSCGHSVFNPAENTPPSDFPADMNRRPYFMRIDIFAIVGDGWSNPHVDCVALLNGWAKSRGTRLEVEIAAQLDIPIVWAESLQLVSAETLQKVAREYLPGYLEPCYEGVAA